MKKVRIGNDISVTWSIKDNGTPINMTDYDASVRLYDAYMNECKSTWRVGPDNVYLYFSAVDQDRLGVYTIVLELKDKVTGGVYTIDSGNAFELVLRTEMAGGPDSDDVKVVSHELSSDLSVVVPGLKGVNVEEHLVFEKGFASKGDVIVDDIVIDTRRVETIDLSPEVTLDGFVPSERHVPSTKAMAKYVGKYIETHGTSGGGGASGGGGFREIKVGDESIDAELTPVVKLSARDKSKDHLSVDIENNGVVIGLTDKAVENLGRAANSLQKTGDTATGLIIFEAGLQIGTEKVTVVDTSKDGLNANKDNSLPTSKAVVENTLSSKTEDTAKEKIIFNKGLDIGKYEPLMSGGSIDEDGNAELNSLKLRESLIVPEIKYNRATVFKGIQYLTFGGGVIESVTSGVDRSGTLTLKLEDGEPLSVKKGDLCVGFWHSMKGEDNSDDNYDGKNGNFRVQGFAAIYFKVLEVLDENKGKIKYLLRDGYNVHPQKGLNFACYSNNITNPEDADYDEFRHACKITTTDYEIRLQNLHNWEYSSDNIYRIEGKLDGFSMTAVHDGIRYEQGFNGHGVVFGNAYMYGTLQQFDREVWRMVLSYENDNILSGDKQLTVTVYRNDVKAEYGGNSATSGQVKLWSLKRNGTSYRDIGANGTIILSEADIPNGSDNVTFEVVATVISTGVEETNNNEGTNETNNKEIVVSQSVTFHRLKQGTEGRGIIDVREYYAVSDDNVNAPTSDWKTPSQNEAIPTTTKDKRYLWNYEEIEYNKEDENGDTTKKTTPAVIGTYGDDGRGIKSVTNYYLVSASDSGVTTATTGWAKTPPKTDPVKKYLWNYEVVTYTDDVEEETPPAIIGTHGEKGNDGNDGKDAVQPNYMDGTSVDGTVERNEWKVNTFNNSSNPYRVNDKPQFEDFPHLTLNPVVFGKKCRFSFDIKGSYETVSSGAYYALQAEFSLPWVRGIVQPTENLSRLYGYVDLTINGTTYRSGRIDSGYSYTKEVTVSNVSVLVARNSTTTAPSISEFGSSANLTTTYKYLFVRLAITKSNGGIQYSGALRITDYTATTSVTVSASNATLYTNVEELGKITTSGETISASKEIGKQEFQSAQPNLSVNKTITAEYTFPTNTTDFKAYLRIYKMYNSTNNYTTYKNIKAELWDEKRGYNTAYIPSENDKARATNVNLLDGTRNGKNSEGKEIWTKTTNNRGTITFGDNLFTLTSQQVHYEGNCMSITSPKITLLQGNYTLSFDMKMVNCYGARLVINGTPHSTIASTTDWTTHRILLPKYSGEKTFRFDSFLSTAAGTTSHLYIRNIKLEEGCFGTAWTISENDKGGKPGFTYRPCGTYDKYVKYTSNSEVKDVVYYDKKYYVCVNQPPTAGIPPTNTTYWTESSYIKFLSVEALFADNLFTNAIQSGSGYFDGLNAKYVKISGELNATKGTFHDVVINGAYNKLIQTITDDNWAQFFHKDDYGTYPLLHSWGDVVKIDLKTLTNITNHINLPSLYPIDQNKFESYTAYKKDSEGNVVEITSHDDIRSLLGRQIILYIAKGLSQLSFFTNVFYKVEQPLTREFNALSIDYDQFFTTYSGFGINSGMTLILQLKLGYRVIGNEPCEMLYWEVTTINKWIE